MFVYLMDEIHIGINNADFVCLKNTIMRIPPVVVEVLYYGVAMRLMDQAVSALVSVILKYSLTVTQQVALTGDGLA